jgi:hypothetical protein
VEWAAQEKEMGNAYDDMAARLGVGGGMTGAVGLDQIIGALEEIVGGTAASEVLQLAQLKAAGGVGVRPVVRDKHRVQPAPWPAQAITAAATATVTLGPQRLVQILAIVIPSSLGTLFTLNDIRVGQQTQLITTGTMLVQMFSEVADGNRSKVKFDSADVGNTVALDFTNLDAANTQTIRGMLVATAVYG